MTPILARKRLSDRQPPRDAASWLSLAASPVFGLMAWTSAKDMGAAICAADSGLLPIGGMAWMYLLMSIFHLPPWLKLASAFARPFPPTHPGS